ncbi:hypothetical protein I204_05023 [Kwoniella mangroviensis CBS 8886]|nr:hypothetical protein I204_05023 [Kwoniella mangroviensis CBS 8886]
MKPSTPTSTPLTGQLHPHPQAETQPHSRPAFIYIPTSNSTAPPTDPTPISIPDSLPPSQPYESRRTILNRAYPLLFLVIIDTFYTYRHFSSLSFSTSFISFIRIITLVYVGFTTRWRYKKSWVMLLCGLTLIYSIWEGCKRFMTRGGDDSNKEAGRDGKYLMITSILSIIEYLSYLLLLRLFPPPPSSHTANLSYKLPLAQTPSSVRYRSTSTRNTPGSVRFHPQSQHRRHVSRGTLRSVRVRSRGNTIDGRMDNSAISQLVGSDQQGMRYEADQGDVFTSSTEIGMSSGYGLERRSLDGSSLHPHEDEYEEDQLYDDEEEQDYEQEGYDTTEDESSYSPPRNTINLDNLDNLEGQEVYDLDGNEVGEEEDDDQSVSSISSSSIIDLPPPLMTLPSRSTSLNINMNIIGLENSPIVGPLIRRSRSARFVPSSWGSLSPNSPGRWFNNQNHIQNQQNRDQAQEELGDYGTFEG